MGLDMYLTAEHFIWDHGEHSEKATKLREAIAGVMGDTPGKVTNIVTEAAYWRKANVIHGWIVENVQDGIDECQKTLISRVQLTELRDLCKTVLANIDTASENLPTISGYFFGNTEYDEDYEDDLKDTIEQLDVVLDEKKYPPKSWDFYYQASW